MSKPKSSTKKAASEDPVQSSNAVDSFQSMVDEMRPLIEAGNGLAVLNAVALCAEARLAIPDWLGDAYLQRYKLVTSLRVASLDDAFGRPSKKHARLESDRRRAVKMFPIFVAIQAARFGKAKRALDAGLFEEIGEQFHIGKTQCEEIYREAKRVFSGIGVKSAADEVEQPLTLEEFKKRYPPS